jgi:hypothetical protein
MDDGSLLYMNSSHVAQTLRSKFYFVKSLETGGFWIKSPLTALKGLSEICITPPLSREPESSNPGSNFGSCGRAGLRLCVVGLVVKELQVTGCQ